MLRDFRQIFLAISDRFFLAVAFIFLIPALIFEVISYPFILLAALTRVPRRKGTMRGAFADAWRLGLGGWV